jgi:regulator of telomere elongation helicase 1
VCDVFGLDGGGSTCCFRPKQIWIGCVPVGPSGKTLNSSFRSRDTAEYKSELGNAIVNFARIVPDGVLVFFPSYTVMHACVEAWKATNVWERISKCKLPVVEPRDSADFASTIREFSTQLESEADARGAVFFAVCRGKLSEGLDFADRAGRAVIITGIPFAQRLDKRVRAALDSHRKPFPARSSNSHLTLAMAYGRLRRALVLWRAWIWDHRSKRTGL